MISPLLVAFSLVALVGAQSNSTSAAVQIEAIEAHFTDAGIVPNLLPTFDPSAVMTVNFDGVGDISPGQALSQTQVKPMPNISITPANSSVNLGNTFTIAMVDANFVGFNESQGQTRHWLVYNVTLNGTASSTAENVTFNSGTAITSYAGPAPASGSGAHRYVILLYSQPSSFSPPSNMTQPGAGVGVFNLESFVSSSGLVGPVAAMYFTVEVGTASFSVSPTSSVVTSTLPVPTASGSGAAHTFTPSTTTNGAAGLFAPELPSLVSGFSALVALAFAML